MRQPDLKIANHGAFSLEGFQGVDPLPTLSRTLIVFAESNLHHFLSAGTALGIHRDQRFIPHDTDLDIAVTLDWDEGAYVVATDLVRRMARANLPLVRSIIYQNRPMQLVFSDLANHGTLVDVEFYYMGLVDDAQTVHYKPEGRVSLSAYISRRESFGDIRIPMPEPIEEYLEERYGPDWKTPTPEKGAWQSYTAAFTPWD